MPVEPEEAYSRVEHEGYVVYFCSRDCEEQFTGNPKAYLSKMRRVHQT